MSIHFRPDESGHLVEFDPRKPKIMKWEIVELIHPPPIHDGIGVLLRWATGQINPRKEGTSER